MQMKRLTDHPTQGGQLLVLRPGHRGEPTPDERPPSFMQQQHLDLRRAMESRELHDASWLCISFSITGPLDREALVAAVRKRLTERRATVTLPGGDLAPIFETTEQACIRLCLADRACTALTYNAHRIHYDTGWAAHEGYPGLVVHGPLQVLLLGELLRRSGPGLVGHELDYRLRRPAVGTQRLVAEPGEDGLAHGAQVRDAAGRVTASGRIAPLATSPAPTTPAGSAG